MPKTVASVVLPGRVQQLLDERSKHDAAIAHIDQILSKIGSALGSAVEGVGLKPRLGRPPKSSMAMAVPMAKKRRRRKGRKFKLTAEESILAFIKQHKNPTTQEINKQWTGEGRGGTADNTLSKMGRDKIIKREPLEGMRGSRFLIA